MTIRLSLGVALVLCAACAASRGTPVPLSIEFGQDVYLTDDYLGSTPGARCGPPTFAPGGTEVGGPLPDGSWFRLFAIPSSDGDLDTVVLERGWRDHEAQMTMRLDGVEGIVRLREQDRDEAWGINHAWADWMRGIGARARALDCASARAPR